jgi:hypothetical protein
MFRTLTRQAINPVQYINKNVSVYSSVLYQQKGEMQSLLILVAQEKHTEQRTVNGFRNSCLVYSFIVRRKFSFDKGGDSSAASWLTIDPMSRMHNRSLLKTVCHFGGVQGTNNANGYLTDTHISEASAAHMQFSIEFFRILWVVLHADGQAGN